MCCQALQAYVHFLTWFRYWRWKPQKKSNGAMVTWGLWQGHEGWSPCKEKSDLKKNLSYYRKALWLPYSSQDTDVYLLCLQPPTPRVFFITKSVKCGLRKTKQFGPSRSFIWNLMQLKCGTDTFPLSFIKDLRCSQLMKKRSGKCAGKDTDGNWGVQGTLAGLRGAQIWRRLFFHGPSP